MRHLRAGERRYPAPPGLHREHGGMFGDPAIGMMGAQKVPVNTPDQWSATCRTCA